MNADGKRAFARDLSASQMMPDNFSNLWWILQKHIFLLSHIYLLIDGVARLFWFKRADLCRDEKFGRAYAGF
jgi:hypothetical protein